MAFTNLEDRKIQRQVIILDTLATVRIPFPQELLKITNCYQLHRYAHIISIALNMTL